MLMIQQTTRVHSLRRAQSESKERVSGSDGDAEGGGLLRLPEIRERA
jgi:hypothetical protein